MKPPETLYIDNSLVDNAVSLWRSGQVVAIPTETVYGLAADATNGEAVARIYATKSRPRFNPLIVHVTGSDMAKRYAEWNDAAEKLTARYWPGPLTIVLKRRADCSLSELVSAGGDTVALRMPSHPVTQQLLAAFGGGIAAPSANRSGRISPTTAAHVKDEFGDTLPLIIDGGACAVGLESTVVDVSGGEAKILRPGSITRAMLEEVVPVTDAGASSTLKSPGLLESHYAPAIPVRLNAQEVHEGEALLAFGTPLTGAVRTMNLSRSGDLVEAAANLFASLRALDVPHHRGIAVMPIPQEGIGEAINDRLKRAAAPR